jgi:hypothetical protein
MAELGALPRAATVAVLHYDDVVVKNHPGERDPFRTPR